MSISMSPVGFGPKYGYCMYDSFGGCNFMWMHFMLLRCHKQLIVVLMTQKLFIFYSFMVFFLHFLRFWFFFKHRFWHFLSIFGTHIKLFSNFYISHYSGKPWPGKYLCALEAKDPPKITNLPFFKKSSSSTTNVNDDLVNRLKWFSLIVSRFYTLDGLEYYSKEKHLVFWTLTVIFNQI